MLANEGMSTRAIAPIVGASQKTVDRDIRGESFDSPAPESSPLTDEPGQVVKLTGSNSVVNPGEDALSTTEGIGATR